MRPESKQHWLLEVRKKIGVVIRGTRPGATMDRERLIAVSRELQHDLRELPTHLPKQRGRPTRGRRAVARRAD